MALTVDLSQSPPSSDSAHFSSAPYPGLRPFEPEEHDIFFGREKQTDQILGKLPRSKLLAVVGPSGSGKSSLVRAGLIASLKAGFMANAGSRWRIAVMRPGEDPFGGLTAALMTAEMSGKRAQIDPDARLFVDAALRRGPLGLVEFIRESRLCDGASVLLLVDQFEELFRFREERGANEADAFVSLLLATLSHKRLPIYVAITMRSDYLGDCALFHGLPEAVSDSQYLTPKLTREECASAITGPARVFGGEIDGVLVNRLLNDFGRDADQLPVLQHALMRMWSLGQARRQPGAKSSRIVLTVEDYGRVGGLGRALSRDAEEALAELSPEQKRVVEILFKRLSARRIGRADTRTPASIERIRRIAGVELADVAAAADTFRGRDLGFLTPAAEEPLTDDTLLDISHESLIRNWERLSVWVGEEAEAAAEYARLKDSARLWDAGKAPLWDTSNLERALAWRAEVKPNPDWAERYGSSDEFALAMRFLSESEKARQAELARAEAARQRQLRRARGLTLLFAASVCVLLLMGLLYYYLVIAEHFGYYATFVKTRGVPRGIRTLTAAQLLHRPISMKIVRRGIWGPVVRMEVVNGRQEPVAPMFSDPFDIDDSSDSAAVRWEYVYDNERTLISEIAFDISGHPVRRLHYAPAGPARAVVAYYAGPSGIPLPNKPFIHIDYSPQGYEIHLGYRDRAGRPAQNRVKAVGQKRAYDAVGRLVAVTSLGADDQPKSDAYGNVTMKTSYDIDANAIESVALDAAGQPISTKEGWSKRQYAYDAYGNIVEQSFFDESGRPAHHQDGYHKVKHERDDHGSIVRSTYWDAKGGAAVDVDGCYGHRIRHDDRDDVTERGCIGKDGAPARNRHGYATWQATYDDRRNVVERVYLDPEGRPSAISDGYSRVKYAFDGRGREIRVAYFGADGQPVSTKLGFASSKSQYDEEGNLTGSETRAASGELVETEKGFARAKSTYDAFGNIIEKHYLGADDKPAIDPSGYAGWRSRFDVRGNEVVRIYLGRQDDRAVSIDGYAGWRADYDELGNEIRRSYVGLRDEPVFSVGGVAGFTSEHDAWSNETRRRFFGANGKPAAHERDDAGWDATYDGRGNQLEIRFVDVTGSPTLHRWQAAKDGEGYARVKRAFDARGKLTEESYFGVRDDPALGEEYFARVVHTYDERGNLVDSSYFGIHGEAIAPRGYHRIGRTYDERGNEVEIQYLNAEGALTTTQQRHARLVKEHDPYGRVVAQYAFKADGERAVLPSGCHKEVWTRDAFGNATTDECQDAAGQPELRTYLFSTQMSQYDSRGNLIEATYRGAHGEKVLSNKRFARVHFDLDDLGNATAVSLFGINDEPVVGSDGYAQMKRKYGQGNRLLETSFFGEEGKPMLKNGYWRTVNEYDDRGQKTWVRYFDTSDKPRFVPSERCASYHIAYDEQGNESERSYFGADGKPVYGPDGFHRIVSRYNERRQPVEVALYDGYGKLLVGRDRYARIARKYDDDGHLVEVATFDAYEKSLTSRYGYARATYQYDAQSNETEVAYFGADGKPIVANGAATTKRRYDDVGNAVEESYFDVVGRKMWPVSRKERQFHELRRLAEERYFGPDDKPVRLFGFLQHITRYEYDDRGNRIGATYFGPNEEPSNGMSDDWKTCARWYAKYSAEDKRIETGCARP